MLQQNSKIKLLYFTEDGKRVPKKDIENASYVHFVGRGTDEFFLLPPVEKESFVSQLKRYVKIKKESKNYRVYVYDKKGDRVNRGSISKAKFFTVKHKNQELFTDEFPKNIHAKYKEQYLQEVLKQTIKVLTKKEKLIPIEQLPVKTKDTSDEIIIKKSVNASVNDVMFRTYISDLFYGNILLDNRDYAINFISESIESGIENCFAIIRKEGISKSESYHHYKWRITLTVGTELEETFATSSEICNKLQTAKDQVIKNIKSNYNQNKTEGYDFSIKELYLRKIKVVAYETIK